MNARSSKQKSSSSTVNPHPKLDRRERQIVRILKLLQILGQNRSLTVYALAAEFRTRRETIYRDLRVLQDAGFPITGDERGRLSRPRLLSSHVPDIRFSASELDALLAAIAQTQIALPNAKTLSSAALKLEALRDVEPNQAPAGLGSRMETWACGSKDYRAHESHIAVLIEAILRKKRCVVKYRTPSRSEPKTYEFDPYRFLFIGGGLYIVGSVPKHGGTTTLAVDRLTSVVLSAIQFEVDSAFDPRQCRDDAFGVSWQDPTKTVLHFRADQAPYIRERLWHPSQELIDLADGSLQLSFRAGGPFEVRRWILGWGDAVEVISPDDLREQVSQILESALRVYRS